MKMVMLCRWLFLVLGGVSAHGQEVVYDVWLSGRNVGHLTVSPAQGGSPSHQNLKVEGNINTFFYKVIYVGENTYEKGVLKTSLSSQHVNGQFKEKTQTYQKNEGYLIAHTEEKKPRRLLPEMPTPILNTVTSLYYREPVNYRQVYSERYGQMVTIDKVGPAAYKVNMPDGKATVYKYEGGRCQEVLARIAGLSLNFKLRETNSN
ncbi:hypothetical protein GCM10027275_11450 [Rhabdobacter roseus]|uniref:DUF3108 domain-containing protein n=1 Tax=Rhabdobacter roseus TaxID=1655419 RepID=A0A840TMR6_9BACT|nr:DUF6134 family protein [Rhabdobacter roseus]MBB5283057.1 hypothetical protein [Rhabdobacter roseus]